MEVLHSHANCIVLQETEPIRCFDSLFVCLLWGIKSHDYGGWEGLGWASWRPRRAYGPVSVWFQRLKEIQRDDCISSSPKASRLEIQQESVFQPESEGQKSPMFQLSSQAGVPSYGALLFCRSLIDWGPPTLGGAIHFIQSTDSYDNLMQKHSHRYTQNNVWSNVWASCGTSQVDT